MAGGNCNDALWLKGLVLDATKSWFVRARKITDPNDLDPTKKFTDAPYNITFPAFLQLCNFLAGRDDGTPAQGPGAINVALKKEGCVQRLILGPAWRQQHQTDMIAIFVSTVANMILKPPQVGV